MEQRPEVREKVRLAEIWGKSILAKGEGRKGKQPGVDRPWCVWGTARRLRRGMGGKMKGNGGP